MCYSLTPARRVCAREGSKRWQIRGRIGGMTRGLSTGLLALVLLTGSTAWAQSPLAGNWNSLRFEDEQDRGRGPDLGDYSGLAINSAARLFADSWDASRL